MNFNLTPPTETTTISANRVLVLAPHYDDEVFGCGGLLAELAESGADITVLYLTDSSGGSEITENRETYADRRRAEAKRGLEILGVTHFETLDIPDGDLASSVDTAADAIRQAILDHRPDLALSVSPCEITSDHRAAFTSLHHALSPLRGGTELDQIMAGCRILLYEVNHPAYPDLLVDVSRREEALTTAMDAHASQLELHNYREAALGMRHYRAFSLPAGITAAEAYRGIGFMDLVTHSHGDLVRKLGGVSDPVEFHDGPIVSVIVRTKDRPKLLSQALGSIASSTYRCVELVLVNDGGETPSLPSSFPFPVVLVDVETNLGRAAAANAGVDAATGDYVSFLDDDDLMAPEHLRTLIGLVTAADIDVAYTDAAVGIYELDGDSGWTEVDRRLPYSRDFDPELLLVENYIPLNTLIIERSLFEDAGPFDPALEFFEDWDFLIRLAAVAPFHHLPRVTAEYRHFRGSGHHILGEQPRLREDFLRMKATVIQRQSERLDSAVLARVVDGLRAETVAATEEATANRTELAGLRRDCETLRASQSRHLGEIQSLDESLGRHRLVVTELQAEIARLQAEETSLRSNLGKQNDRVSELYAEIERLTALVDAMQDTKAWQWHRRLERLKGNS